MSINSKLAYYNIQVKTAPIVEKIAKLIFTLSGTKQVYSDIYINKIDSRFPSFRLYRYQADVYEAITKGNNVLIVSGTGSGKTEACFFPLLPQLNRGVSGQVLAIYPTNVLASQQQERIQAYGKKFGINIQHWSGETIKEIFIPTAEIVTSNPNFLLDNFRKNNRYEKFKEVFESLNTLIFDEIHIYNAREIALLTEVIRLIIPKQIIFLSATVGNLDEVAQTLSNINGKSTYIFKGSSQKAVTQYIILPQLSYKDQISLFIQYLIEPGMTIIFTQSISQADNLRISVIEQAMFASFLQQFPHTTRKDILEDMVTVHHSGLSKEERLKLEKRLKSGSMLVFSPKTLAQGIDVANVVRVVHLGLPNSLADFLQREGRAGRRQETQWTESIIICSNDYDELIFTNQATFEAYINGTPERILLLPASPIAQLFNACFHYKILPSGLKTENKQILKQYGMLETINSKKLTPTGKMFWKEELSFYGPSRQIYYLQQGGKQRNKPDRISVKELFTKFQPNTLHYKYGVLQKVINYTGEGFYIQPVFEEVKESLIKKLFKGNSLRSYTVNYVTPKDKQNIGGIGRISIQAVQITWSFLRTDLNPPEYEIYQTFPAITKPFTILTSYLIIPFSFSPINMEMAIHCFVQALRITQDIRYSEIEHSLIGRMGEGRNMQMLVYEAEFSGLLLNLKHKPLIQSAKDIAKHFLNQIINKNGKIIYPIPTCRYLPRNKDVLSEDNVIQGLRKLEKALLSLKMGYQTQLEKNQIDLP